FQRAAEQAIRDGIQFAHRAGHPDAAAGAAVVLDARTGALYALASYPRYNQLLAAQEPSYLTELLKPSAASPLLDRATQGIYPTVTPLQLAVAYAALANGGTVVRPHVAGSLGGRKLAFPPRRRVRLRHVWAIRDALYSATHDPWGTSAAIFGNFPIPVAGKTGTAEAPPGSDHSWYASWAPAGHPRIVVVVLIEHGGFGAQAAAPAAREIYSAFFHVKAKAAP